jgi:ABC-2 type transport system permease protein
VRVKLTTKGNIINKALKSINRLLAISEKEWIQIRRDWRSLILSLILPVLLLLLFAYALNMDVKNVRLAVCDQDKTSLSRKITAGLTNNEYLTLFYYLNDPRDIDRLMDQDVIQVALVFPPGFSAAYYAGKQSDLQLIVDGSDSTTATVASSYIRSIILDFNKQEKEQELAYLGLGSLSLPINIESRIWYNPELKSKNFIIPGIIVLIMAIISALITSLTISREWERGTMESLISTPLHRYEVYFGKLIPYIFIALFDVICTFALAYFVFKVPFKGSFVEFYLVAILFLIGTSSLGMMLSSATRSQVLSVQLAIIITYLPSFILSGYVFPILNMPDVVQAITYIIPAKYLMIYVKSLAMRGIGFSLLWIQILFLFLFALIVGLICLLKLRLTLPEK